MPNYDDKRLLVVVAHPDDETFGMGGTIAHYAHAGVEVHLICATRGEVGEVEPEKLAGFDSVGDLRTHELSCAANVLGIREVHYLDYRDSGMPGSPDNDHAEALVQAPLEIVAEKIAMIVRKIKPQVILTFDPNGGYLHPDHIAIHQATVCAFELAGDEQWKKGKLSPFLARKLYYHTMPHTFLKLVVKFMPLFGRDPRKFGKNGDIDLTAILADDFPTHARINYWNVAGIREAASACHASQGGDRTSGYLVTWLMRLISSNETYMRAVPPVKDGRVEKDLFAGVE